MIVLDLLNQMSEAKINNSLDPEIFSKVVDATNNLFCRKVMRGQVSEHDKESYLSNCPTSNSIFFYNHHGLESVHSKLSNNLNKIESYIVNPNDNDMNNIMGRTM